MKRLVAFFSFIIILYSIYYDIYVGTLPIKNDDMIKTEEVINNTPSITFESIKVAPGDTVLSIVEKINKDHTITSIDKIVQDFETLNPNVKAELLQIGKVYHFPVYRE